MMTLGEQSIWLAILALPIASISWTVTHEQILQEFQEWCKRRSENSSNICVQKGFYLFTCEYCLSHYVTILFLIVTRYHLLFPDWRGSMIAFFSLPWVANAYIALFGRAKLGVSKDRVELEAIEKTVEAETTERPPIVRHPAA
jgi:hypothetical protein